MSSLPTTALPSTPLPSTPPRGRPAAGAGDAAPATPAAAPEPTASMVLMLQSVRAWPCVSVLMSTTAADRMTTDDADRLRALVAAAESRLLVEGLVQARATIVPALHRRLEQAVAGPTAQAVGLFAAQAADRLVRLPLPVRDRTVVERTFVTRDLVRALHRTPRHLVLTLDEHRARLLDGVGDQLRPVQGGRFPLSAAHAARGAGPRGRDAWWHTVDRALRAHTLTHPAPLVLVAGRASAHEFLRLARTTTRLAGVVTDTDPGARPEELRHAVRSVLDAYLLGREHEALALLRQRAGQARAVSGLPSCWLAARHEAVEMLVVDPSLHVPARVSPDGDVLRPLTGPAPGRDAVDTPGAGDGAAVDQLDDAIDELVELVLLRGGWVAFTSTSDALADHGGVALTLRG